MYRFDYAQTHGYTADDLINKKNEKEAIYWEEKVASHLHKRGYNDQIFLQGRCESLQRIHDVQADNRRLLEKKFHELRQYNRELKKHKGQADRIARDQAIDKNQFIALLEQDMEERQLMDDLKAEKYRKQGEINQIAPSIIEKEELSKILEVLYAHRVLSEIIKVKSNLLILSLIHI